MSSDPQPNPHRRRRPRWALKAQAVMWRNLMDIGMQLHMLAAPPAPKPTFKIDIPSQIASKKGKIPLHFYVPESYNSEHTSETKRIFPIVLSFHGGGFTIGRATGVFKWLHICPAILIQHR